MRVGYCPRCTAAMPAFRAYLWWRTLACPACGALLRRKPAWSLLVLALVVAFEVHASSLFRDLVVAVPALVVDIPLLGAGALLAVFCGDVQVVAKGPFCPACLYNRAGLAPDAPCPECGTVPAGG